MAGHARAKALCFSQMSRLAGKPDSPEPSLPNPSFLAVVAELLLKRPTLASARREEILSPDSRGNVFQGAGALIVLEDLLSAKFAENVGLVIEFSGEIIFVLAISGRFFGRPASRWSRRTLVRVRTSRRDRLRGRGEPHERFGVLWQFLETAL